MGVVVSCNAVAAAVQLMKGLKETEVLCSEGLFRLLSPSMDIVSVTIFRLAPNTFVGTASSLAISVDVCVVVHSSCSAIAASLIDDQQQSGLHPHRSDETDRQQRSEGPERSVFLHGRRCGGSFFRRSPFAA